MKKVIFTFICIVAGLYWGLHLILGSSPIQQRVLLEIQKALANYGFHLEIESIEFSALVPKIYLNRVTVSSTKKAPITLDVPVTVDKLKIQFSPLELVRRKIVINEAVLFNPKLVLPRADKIYKKIKSILDRKKKIQMDGDSFTVELTRIGVVDALFNVVSKDPELSLRSRSLTAFLTNEDKDFRNVEVSASDLEFERKSLNLLLEQVELDFDFYKKKISVNKLELSSPDLFLRAQGEAILPLLKNRKPSGVQVAYEFKLPLEILNKVPEFSGPALTGLLESSGRLRIKTGKYTGEGAFHYESLFVDGYEIGAGDSNFSLKEDKFHLNQMRLAYAGGTVASKRLSVQLNDKLSFEGKLKASAVRLEGILKSVKVESSPVSLSISADYRCAWPAYEVFPH